MPEGEQDLHIQVAEIKKDVEYIKDAVDRGFREIPDKYVTKTEFEPIRNLVYGLVSLILMGFIGALIALVFKS